MDALKCELAPGPVGDVITMTGVPGAACELREVAPGLWVELNGAGSVLAVCFRSDVRNLSNYFWES